MRPCNRSFPELPLKRLITLLICSASLTLQSCGLFRVDLKAPSPQAPVDERIEAYEALKPVGEEIPFYSAGTRTEGGVSKTSQALLLANGLKVSRPEDLRVAVPPNSNTSKAIKKFGYHDRRSNLLKLGAWALFMGAITTGILGTVVYDNNDHGNPNHGKSIAIWVGSGVLLAGGITTTVFAIRHAKSAQKSRYQAFKSYDQDLLDYLQIEEVPAKERGPYGPETPEVANAHRNLHSRSISSALAY